MLRRLLRERAESELAEIIRTGRDVSPRRYRRLVRRSGAATTEGLKAGREVGHIRGVIDWIDDRPAFMKEQ